MIIWKTRCLKRLRMQFRFVSASQKSAPWLYLRLRDGLLDWSIFIYWFSLWIFVSKAWFWLSWFCICITAWSCSRGKLHWQSFHYGSIETAFWRSLLYVYRIICYFKVSFMQKKKGKRKRKKDVKFVVCCWRKTYLASAIFSLCNYLIWFFKTHSLS